jgi:Rrf2 family nitric oxide-sensitive transcriptional repressor
MRLSMFTDYTLRTLMFLALRPDRLVTIADIADAYGISNNHLMKVVHQLALSGDVRTVRGQRGGLRLARPANEINVGTVVRRTEADLEMVPCAGAHSICVIRPECVLAGVVDEALRAFMATLDRYTLADLVRPRAGLARLLRTDEHTDATPVGSSLSHVHRHDEAPPLGMTP